MIHQFAELGQYYQAREGLSSPGQDQLAQYAHDPSAKFRTKTVLLLVFTTSGFNHVHVEEYDDTRKLHYLYRPGPANGCDATPTSGLREVKKDLKAEFAKAFREELKKKLARLSRSIKDAIAAGQSLPAWEITALTTMRDWLHTAAGTGGHEDLDKLVQQTTLYHPPTTRTRSISSTGAIISVAWQDDERSTLKRVGDFEAFRGALTWKGDQSASRKKGIDGAVQGTGQCCVCGKPNTIVYGLLQIQQFKLYTLDKPGSVSGGFDPERAWVNFPACRECCYRVEFAGERVKKELAFDYYGFKYLVLPFPVQQAPTHAYEFLDRMIAARVNRNAGVRLTAAEAELFYVISQESNLLQVDLLFYQPDPQSFRPALYVSGLLPTRFKKLFDTKHEVDRHPWLAEASPKTFTTDTFSFGSLRNVFPAAHGGSTFDDDFMAATRAALELRPFSTERLLQVGMRWVQDDYIARRSRSVDRKKLPSWQFRLADLFRSVLFFEVLTGSNVTRSIAPMQIDYGSSGQAERVRAVLSHAPSKLQSDPAAQASFLVGACCSRIEKIQAHLPHLRGSSPFSGKLKGFRLNQADVRGLFVAAQEKAKAYGAEEERKVGGLLECAAAALLSTPERWPLSPNEVSYFFALGHALRPRFAKEVDEDSSGQPE